jgi:vacuolar-type H+-ATPase subunit H
VAKETVEAIRSAELNAAEIEKDALKKSESIILKARENAMSLKTSMVNEALKKAEKDVSETVQQGEEKIGFVKENVQKEILLLKKMSEEREAEAIKLVLSHII